MSAPAAPVVGVGVAARLDHVGVVASDGPALWAAYEQRMGFALTPVSRQAAPRAPGGPAAPLATGNRCAMLHEGRGYVELLAVLDPSRPDNGIGAMLAARGGAGMHILALGVEDAGANLARLRRAGLDVPGVVPLERPVEDEHGATRTARFARLPLPPGSPEGRVQLIRHDTPDLLWQPRWLGHPNRAVALAATVLAADEPAPSAARLSRLAGLPLEPDPAGGYAMRLGGEGGVVRVVPTEALGALLPFPVAPPVPGLPWHAAVVVRTEDGAAAARALLGDAARDGPLGLTVPPSLAGGVAVAFA